MSVRVSILGASGYAGGELLRLLLFHPKVEVAQATSREYKGKQVYKVHPNLRNVSDLAFSSDKELEACDVLFTALPHGVGMKRMPELLDTAKKVIDLSADFRLNTPALYQETYAQEHTAPELLKEAVYGIVELHREEMKKARIIGGAGCNATAAILALYPFVKKGLIEPDIVVDTKGGSSEGGQHYSLASHHPERAQCVRAYKPTGHRHVAEMQQELSALHRVNIGFSPHAIDLVRGIQCTCHTRLKEGIREKEVWKALREVYGPEPFIRFVKERSGIYRYPEPKLLSGTNYCDIGFEKDSSSQRLVVLSAIDNLGKGASGQAVQAFNVVHGFEETTGLEFPGLHPV